MLVGKRERQDRVRSLLRRGLIAVVATLIAIVLIYTAFRRWTYLGLPGDDGPPLPANVKIDVAERGTRISLGDSWMERKDGLWRIHLVGNPRLVGHCHGMLVNRIFEPLELYLDGMRRARVVSGVRGWLFRNRLRWRLRGLMQSVDPHQLAEVAAFARTIVDTRPMVEDPFQRLLYYHALPDVLQAVRKEPLFPSVALAAWGRQTSGGHVLIGRSLELGLGGPFQRDRALIVVRGRDRIPFASLGWPGMLGVLSGVNAERIFVGVVHARTDAKLASGTPALFIARELLERARTLEQALKIAKRARPMGSLALLVADGKSKTAAVIELTPRGMWVRPGPSKSWLALTNHLQHKKLEADASNDWLRRYTPSEVRLKRLGQLVARFSGRIDPATVALMLRNRSGVSDAPLAVGHRAALDSLRASHALIVDLTDLMLWVPRPPHLLGAMAAIDLKPLFGLTSSANSAPQEIGSDPLLGSVALRRYELVRDQLDYARRLRRAGARAEALDYARRAVEGAPKLPEAQLLVGDLLWATGRREQAKSHYRELLELSPPYRLAAERVRGLLGR